MKRIGLKQIIKESGIEGKNITPYEIGFVIAPRINAIGRLEHAIEALRLLCTTDIKRAEKIAQHIGLKNKERQDLVEKSVYEARLTISKGAKLANFYSATAKTASVKEERSDGKTEAVKTLPKIIILVSNHWHEGIIGLIASKIAEEFYRPTFVLTKTDLPAGRQAITYKGSARSIPSFHVTEFLRSLKKNLIDVGGHKQAAGFTLEKKQLEEFTKNAQKLANKLIVDKDLERKIEADLKIPISKIDINLVKLLEQLAPFGIGNPRPTFYSEGILTDAQLLGKTQKHLKLFVDGFEFIAFGHGKRFNELSRSDKIKIVYNLDINEWNNKKTVQGKIIFLESLQY